jgi:hypothetical protein
MAACGTSILAAMNQLGAELRTKDHFTAQSARVIRIAAAVLDWAVLTILRPNAPRSRGAEQAAKDRGMKSLFEELKYSIWLYFLPVTNPMAAWKMLGDFSQTRGVSTSATDWIGGVAPSPSDEQAEQ